MHPEAPPPYGGGGQRPDLRDQGTDGPLPVPVNLLELERGRVGVVLLGFSLPAFGQGFSLAGRVANQGLPRKLLLGCVGLIWFGRLVGKGLIARNDALQVGQTNQQRERKERKKREKRKTKKRERDRERERVCVCVRNRSGRRMRRRVRGRRGVVKT